MFVRPNGDLVPHLTGRCSERCRICLDVCPFAEGFHDPRTVNFCQYAPVVPKADDANSSLRMNQESNYHDDTGWYVSSLAGYSETHRATSASGGLLTLSLEELLVSGKVDRVAAVRPSPPENGRLFDFVSVSTVDGLRACAGSAYYQVEISGLIREILAQPDMKWVVVGAPCLCTALRRAVRTLPKLGQSIAYILGLACGMYQNRMYTELLTHWSGVPPSKVKRVRYRVKSHGIPASNYGFVAEGLDGAIGKVVPYQGLPMFLGRNGYFRCNACNFCRDVFAESADACFMDAWLPEYKSDSRGTSLVLARNASINQLLCELADQDRAKLEQISIERLVLSQKGPVRRKRRLIAMRLGSRHSHQDEGTMRDRFEWWLQRLTQNRSKVAWAKYGSRHGALLFGLAMLDLLLIQQIYRLVSKSLGMLLQCCRVRI